MVLREMDCKLDGKNGIRGETVGWPWITLYIGRGHIESRLNLVHIIDRGRRRCVGLCGVPGARCRCCGSKLVKGPPISDSEVLLRFAGN